MLLLQPTVAARAAHPVPRLLDLRSHPWEYGGRDVSRTTRACPLPRMEMGEVSRSIHFGSRLRRHILSAFPLHFHLPGHLSRRRSPQVARWDRDPSRIGLSLLILMRRWMPKVAARHLWVKSGTNRHRPGRHWRHVEPSHVGWKPDQSRRPVPFCG